MEYTLFMTFNDLGLASDLLRAVADQGYDTPTPIQAKAIPAVLEGGDILAGAQTGTGKTAGFTLPMLHRLVATEQRGKFRPVRALVLAPTRELAAQVSESIRTYGKHVPIRSGVVYGGVAINPQKQFLRRGVDVLIATPGRLLDLVNQRAVRLDKVEMLVLDEADRMLDMGFIHDIRRVMALLPKQRQNLLFSATFSDEIKKLADNLLQQPTLIEVARRNTASEQVSQCVHPADQGRKRALLAHLVKTNGWGQALVFTRTKHGSDRLTRYLEKEGIRAVAIHGGKSQGARTRALGDFKRGKMQILVATDIAARGLDIDQLPHVVNFDLPHVPEDYVHRIGRTGRAGNVGAAVSLVSADEWSQLKSIERLIKREIPQQTIAGYEPTEKPQSSRPANKKVWAKKSKSGNGQKRPGGHGKGAQHPKRRNRQQPNGSGKGFQRSSAANAQG